MTSSGVLENVILAKTPRCHGVCVFIFILILIMTDVITIGVGRCYYPFCCDTSCATIFIICGRWKTT